MTTHRSLLLGLLLASIVLPLRAVSVSQFNVTYTEDFDTLAQITASTVPPGWAFIEAGSGANTTYGATPGTSTTGNTYSFGATGGADRAFGGLRTSSVATTIGTLITNDTGSMITNLTIQFSGEQWRLGATGRVDRLDFAFSGDATSLGDGNWSEVDALDFVAPVTSGTVGALDGKRSREPRACVAGAHRSGPRPGANLWLRWVDFDANGSDDGLGIDNFSISAVQTETPPTQSVPDNLPFPAIASVLGGLLWSARVPGSSATRPSRSKPETFSCPRIHSNGNASDGLLTK
jgi:hypothetical protein